MLTNTIKLLLLAAAFAAPGLASAGGAAIPAQPLGTIEAVMDHCAKLIPASAEDFKQEVQALTQGTDEETLAKLRASEEYRQSHAEAVAAIGKLPADEAEKACRQNLAQLQ